MARCHRLVFGVSGMDAIYAPGAQGAYGLGCALGKCGATRARLRFLPAEIKHRLGQYHDQHHMGEYADMGQFERC